jgi:hypothetical protein
VLSWPPDTATGTPFTCPTATEWKKLVWPVSGSPIGAAHLLEGQVSPLPGEQG